MYVIRKMKLWHEVAIVFIISVIITVIGSLLTITLDLYFKKKDKQSIEEEKKLWQKGI